MNELDLERSVIQKEGIKLTRNSKGYTWEIKTLDLDIDKVEKLNNEMLKRFGSEAL